MPKKQCLWPGDGSCPCVVIPKIVAVIKEGSTGFVAQTAHGFDSDGYLLGVSFKHPDTQSRDEAYARLIEAIREWYA